MGFFSKRRVGPQNSRMFHNEGRGVMVKMFSNFSMCPLLIPVFYFELLCAKASTAKKESGFPNKPLQWIRFSTADTWKS